MYDETKVLRICRSLSDCDRHFSKCTNFLQDWVKAVAIRITLNRINTFGDEVFKDPKVLKSYYYAISDLSVGGR